jgi:hypothetical protein
MCVRACVVNMNVHLLRLGSHLRKLAALQVLRDKDTKGESTRCGSNPALNQSDARGAAPRGGMVEREKQHVEEALRPDEWAAARALGDRMEAFGERMDSLGDQVCMPKETFERAL